MVPEKNMLYGLDLSSYNFLSINMTSLKNESVIPWTYASPRFVTMDHSNKKFLVFAQNFDTYTVVKYDIELNTANISTINSKRDLRNAVSYKYTSCPSAGTTGTSSSSKPDEGKRLVEIVVPIVVVLVVAAVVAGVIFWRRSQARKYETIPH